MAGILYPVYQKYYAAIISLKRFNKDNDFFSNIASMDNFFSEYRSTTLVMQKSLSNTQFEEIYEEKSKGIWDRFFNDQRVKTIHKHPFEFTKNIEVTAYFPNGKKDIVSKVFTVENDVPLITLENELKSFFRNFLDNEIFFSASYSFTEKDSGEDLWDKLMEGIITLHKFMDEMYNTINEDCSLCNKLRDKIKNEEFEIIPRDFFLITDYVYYSDSDEFERAERLAMILPGMGRQSIDTFTNSPLLVSGNTIFEKFVLLHAVMQTTELMPAFMIIYKDGTFDLDVFYADIKTTIYRKINVVAKKIMTSDVEEVFFMNGYLFCEETEINMNMTSKERRNKAKCDFLVFMKIDSNLKEEEVVLEGGKICDVGYISKQLFSNKKNSLEIGAINMIPIKQAFMLAKNINNR